VLWTIFRSPGNKRPAGNRLLLFDLKAGQTVTPADLGIPQFFELSGLTDSFTGQYQLYGGVDLNANDPLLSTPYRTAVPEPSSLALLTSGMVGSGLFLARRRRRK
jgi:hypothetical protein